jgi:hypothetical protein
MCVCTHRLLQMPYEVPLGPTLDPLFTDDYTVTQRAGDAPVSTGIHQQQH